MPTRPWWPLPCAELTDGALTLLPWPRVASLPGVREDVSAASTDPRAVEFTTIPSPYTEAMLDAYLAEPGPNCVRWALVVGGRYAGSIDLRRETDAASFGYNTAPWARGRGLMTRAVRAVAAHAFTHGAPRLVIRALPGNAASRHVAEANGFTYAGERGDNVEYVKTAR